MGLNSLNIFVLFLFLQLELPGGKYLKSAAAASGNSNIKPTPCASTEPPSKKPRYDENVKNLVTEKNKLQYKVKLLTQRLKRRNIKILNLKTALQVCTEIVTQDFKNK